MASKIPQDYANLASFAIIVAQSWKANHANYSVKFIDYQTLSDKSEAFRQQAVSNATFDAVRKTNTEALKATNAKIDNAIKILRRYIQGEFATLTDFSAQYSAYGLEAKANSPTYYLPTDNDRRQQQLNILVSKLELASNPFRNKEYGYEYFKALKEEHARHWGNTKTLTVNKSVSSHATRTAFTELKTWLQKLQAQIKIDFAKSEQAEVLKEFGFSF